MITLYEDHPIKCHRESGIRGLDLLILFLVARWGWVVNITPRPLYPRERTLVPIAAQRLVWTGTETRILLPPLCFEHRTVRPTASCYTDYKVQAPVTLYIYIYIYIYIYHNLLSRVLHIDKCSTCVCSVEHMKIKGGTDFKCSVTQTA
jgi:hypothetical protein